MAQENKCPQCGAPVGAGVTPCQYCGETVAAAQPVVKQTPAYQAPPYMPPPSPYLTPQVPFGYSQKSKVVAGLLQLFLGSIGVGRFYLGHVGIGIAQIVVTFITCGIGSIWGFIDGIVILAGGVKVDGKNIPLKE